MSGARGNGLIPVIRPRNDLGVELNRTPDDLGSFTTSSSGATTGILIRCRRDGWIEFGGTTFSNWEFAYGERATKFRALSVGVLYPSPSSGQIILRETSSGAGTGTVVVTDWGWETGFVRAMQNKGSAGLGPTGKSTQPTDTSIHASVTVSTVSGTGQIITPPAGTIYTDYVSPDLPSGTANTDTIYFSATAAGATTSGFPIPPGSSVRFYGEDAVYVYSPTAAQIIRALDHTS